MEDLFCSYEQTLALKKLGFEEPCFGFFDTFTNEAKGGNFPCEGSNKVPLRSQVFRWFRNEHNFYAIILPSYGNNNLIKDRFFYQIPFKSKLNQSKVYYDTHEEAESACIDKLIELLR